MGALQQILASMKIAGGGGGFETPTYKNYIENAASGSSGTISATGTLNIAAGDSVFVFVAGGEDTTGAVCGSDSMTQGILRTVTVVNYRLRMWYLLNASANAAAAVTATFSPAASFRSIFAIQYSGIATSGAADGSSTDIVGNSGVEAASTVNRTAQNITTTVTNTLLLGYHLNWDNPRTTTAATNWTKRGNAGSTMQNVCERIVTSTGTYPSGNFATVSSADPYISIFAAFAAKPV